MAVKTETQTFQIQEKTRVRLVELREKVSVGNEVVLAAQAAVTKYVDKFNDLAEITLDNFGVNNRDPGLSINWETGVVTLSVDRQVPDDLPVETVPEPAVEAAPEVAPEAVPESPPESS